MTRTKKDTFEFVCPAGVRLALFFLSLMVLVAMMQAPVRAQEFNPRPGGGAGNPLAGNADAIAAGEKLFSGPCSGCHGAHAEGGRGPNLANGRLVRRRGMQQLFNSIKNGVPGSDMPPFNLPDQQIWQLLAFIGSLSAPAAEIHLPGDPAAGKELFFGKAGCANCHMVLGQGGFLGPDLSNIGMMRSPNQLKRALLDPASLSNTGFQGVTVATTSGTEITGVCKDHTNYSVVVLDAKGHLHLLPMHDIQKLTFRSGSVMPGDYQQRLTAAEITDLLAYIGKQSVRPVQAALPGRERGGDFE